MNDSQYMGDNPMGGEGSMISLLVIAVAALILVWIPYWRIFQKAGYSGWWSLTLFIPGINLFMFYYLAFSVWPVHRGSHPALETPPARPHRVAPPGNV